MKNQYVCRGSDTVDAAAEASTINVEDLDRIVLHLVQVTDAGTVVLVTEYSLDGTYWITLDASTAESDFAAAAGACVEFTLSDSNGMSKAVKLVRMRASSLAGGGVYTFRASGVQRGSYA
jgi:hypothetical protein